MFFFKYTDASYDLRFNIRKGNYKSYKYTSSLLTSYNKWQFNITRSQWNVNNKQFYRYVFLNMRMHHTTLDLILENSIMYINMYINTDLGASFFLISNAPFHVVSIFLRRKDSPLFQKRISEKQIAFHSFFLLVKFI